MILSKFIPLIGMKCSLLLVHLIMTYINYIIIKQHLMTENISFFSHSLSFSRLTLGML